eukprot:327092-Rhodomonas_salina.4
MSARAAEGFDIRCRIASSGFQLGFGFQFRVWDFKLRSRAKRRAPEEQMEHVEAPARAKKPAANAMSEPHVQTPNAVSVPHVQAPYAMSVPHVQAPCAVARRGTCRGAPKGQSEQLSDPAAEMYPSGHSGHTDDSSESRNEPSPIPSAVSTTPFVAYAANGSPPVEKPSFCASAALFSTVVPVTGFSLSTGDCVANA